MRTSHSHGLTLKTVELGLDWWLKLTTWNPKATDRLATFCHVPGKAKKSVPDAKREAEIE